MRNKEFALKNFQCRAEVGRYNLLNAAEETLRVFVRWGETEAERVNFHLPPDSFDFEMDDFPAEQLIQICDFHLHASRFSSVNERVKILRDWLEAEPDDVKTSFETNADFFDWAWAYRNVTSLSRISAERERKLNLIRRVATSGSYYLDNPEA